MSLDSRLNRIARLLDAPARQINVSAFGYLGDDITPPGTIKVHGSQWAGMVVPAEHSADPVRGLSDEQLAFLRPGDRITAWAWEDDGDVLHNDERFYTWRGFFDERDNP